MLPGTQMDNPYTVEETDDYAVVFKPAKMHSDNLAKDKEDLTTNQNEQEPSVLIRTEEGERKTLLYWFKEQKRLNDKVKLTHRLDYETNGLVLFAKNEKSFKYFKELQDRGEFIKEYSAICVPTNGAIKLEGFPDNSSVFSPNLRFDVRENSFVIESYFRPYGPGRKQVRPVIEDSKKHKEIAKDKGGFYKTEIVEKKDNVFIVRIKRGFRHQIRCHLCWAGFPILNDPLYSNIKYEGLLALRSHTLFFADPSNGERKECRIAALGVNV
jgi:23S rRNA pseudouridine1911/1915/1917 synthase